MRWYAVGLVALSLAGCGSKYKADGPVLDNWDRVRTFSGDEFSRARYRGQPVIPSPVLPVMAFGAHFDLDVILRPKSERWDMTEIARLSTPDGPLWLALETQAGSGQQFLVADVPEIDALMPEIPLKRKQGSFKVEENLTSERLELAIRYTGYEGDEVEARIESDAPYKVEKKRNSPTFNHSEDSLLAVVDMAARQSAFEVDLKVNGRKQRMEKVGGIVPFQFVATQAQGGLAVGSFTVVPQQTFAFDSTMAEIVVRAPGEPEPAPRSEPERKVTKLVKVDPLTTTLQDNQEAIQECYTGRLEENPELAGQILVAFKVAEGKGEGFNVVSNTTEDEALAECLTEQLASVTFPEAVDGDVGFPFQFAAGAGLVLSKTGAVDGSDDSEEPDASEEELPEDALADAELDEEGTDLLAEDPGDEDLLDEEPKRTVQPPARGPYLADFVTVHAMESGNQVEMPWEVSRKGNRVYAVQHSDLRTLTYEYLVHYDALELVRISVNQYGRAVPTTQITFSPALPDLRRSFDGRQVSRYVIDVNGQESYAVGTAEAWWSETGVKLKVTPEAPKWTQQRPMTTSINYMTDRADVTIQRVE